MKLHLPAAGLVLLAATTFAAAQDAVIISPEQDVVIQEYVKQKPLASITLPGVELNIGSVVPDTHYEYVVVDNRTVLVDPGTRRIIKVY